MAMRQRAKRLRRVVRLLTDAKPEFISLVEHGANQSGFKVVKAADEEPGSVRRAPVTVEIAQAPAVARFGVGLARIVFRPPFADKVAVAEWLDGRGYTGYVIEPIDGGGGFLVEGDAGPFVEAPQPVNIEPGVTFYLGVVNRPSETAEKAEPPAPLDPAIITEAVKAALAPIVERLAVLEQQPVTLPQRKSSAAVNESPVRTVRQTVADPMDKLTRGLLGIA